MAIAVEKMKTYVALAEDEIANRKKQCELMHREGCCGIERLYLANGGYEEVHKQLDNH
jgi:hypothetical protein